jgi:hypothetical protein
MVFKIIGGLLIVFGLIDMVGSWTELDVWTDWLGIELPEAVWSFSAYIEIGLGYFLFNLGNRAATKTD